MDFNDTLIFWNELISDSKKTGKKKVDLKAVRNPVLISGAILGFFIGMGYGFLYHNITNTILYSFIGIFLGPIVWSILLVLINSFYFLASAVFGAKKTTMNAFSGPQSLVHSLFAIIFSIIFAASGLLSVLNISASLIFFSIASFLFTLYYLYVMPYVLSFQTGFSKLKSLGISIVIPITSVSLYVLIRSIAFLAPNI
jgi:hypothetical protein